jgi:tellurite resistance protein TerC
MLTLRNLKRLLIAIIGGTVLLLGVAMILLPGPASLVIPAGLGILAIEFAWARHWLHKTREYMERARNCVMPKRTPPPAKRPPVVVP